MFAWLFYNSNAQLLSLQLQPFGFYAVVKKTSKERYNVGSHQKKSKKTSQQV